MKNLKRRAAQLGFALAPITSDNDTAPDISMA
jgi:hypothetical protein